MIGVWNRYFFAPERPEPLALCRIVYCGLLVIYYVVFARFTGWADATAVAYDPVGPWRFLPSTAIASDGTMMALAWLFRATLLLACIGLWTRASLWVAFALSLYLVSAPANFGKVSHSEPSVAWVLLILALSRCGDAWSLDARRRRMRPPPSGEYRWPVRAVWIFLAIVFTFAGWQKIASAGLAWASPDAFAALMRSHFYENEPVTSVGLRIAYVRPLVIMAAVATLVGECLFPLALVNRWLRLVFVTLMFGMQLNISLLFGVYFGPFLPTYVFFIPWAWILFDRRLPRIPLLRHVRPAAPARRQPDLSGPLRRS